MVTLPDKQSERPAVSLRLKRVGVRGVKKQIRRVSQNNNGVLNVIIDVYVDLTPDFRGSHMSRNMEVIDEIIEKATKTGYVDMELLALDIAKRILNIQDKATRAEVNLQADYPLSRKTPVSGREVQAIHKIFARAELENTPEAIVGTKTIGVTVTGITACPCGKELIKDYTRTRLQEKGLDKELIDEILESIPLATHLQRGIGSLSVETRLDARVDADDLIEIVENAMSAPVFEILKRSDERSLVIQAVTHPRFVEDSVRLMLKQFAEKFRGTLPEDTLITAKQINQESVHQHDAFAEEVILLKDLLEGLKNNA
ncbi:MAG: GTP cyclohydrolase MptA [Candidatus Heimdallarchaeota archaeon]